MHELVKYDVVLRCQKELQIIVIDLILIVLENQRKSVTVNVKDFV